MSLMPLVDRHGKELKIGHVVDINTIFSCRSTDICGEIRKIDMYGQVELKLKRSFDARSHDAVGENTHYSAGQIITVPLLFEYDYERKVRICDSTISMQDRGSNVRCYVEVIEDRRA